MTPEGFQGEADAMDLDEDKIDAAVLALLRLTLHDGRRAWKGFDWDSMDRLHRKGWITDPVGKAKSVAFTDDGSGAIRAASAAVVRQRVQTGGGSEPRGEPPRP